MSPVKLVSRQLWWYIQFAAVFSVMTLFLWKISSTLTPTAAPTATNTPSPTPTPTPRRLPTGTFIKEAMQRDGCGEVSIDNGQDLDGVAVLEGIQGVRMLAVYVGANSKFTVTGIQDGTYYLYFTTGEDWDSSLARFTRLRGYFRFEDVFPFATTTTHCGIWEVTLYGVPGGTAETPPVSEAEFPDLR